MDYRKAEMVISQAGNENIDTFLASGGNQTDQYKDLTVKIVTQPF